MRDNPVYAWDDVAAIKDLIRAHPFVTLVSPAATGLVASHYPVLVDDSVLGLQLIGHVGRPDEVIHELGQHEVLVVVQGEHGYVSSGWYDRTQPSVPTWNYLAAHLTGTPELLSADDNLAALHEMVEHFEDRLPDPRHLVGADGDYAARISAGTVGFRLPIDRFVAKRKLSQDKPVTTVEHVIDELSASGPYSNPELAGVMREEESRSGR